MKKRILSFLLALLVTVSILPLSTNAEDAACTACGNVPCTCETEITPDYSENVGKYVKLNANVATFSVYNGVSGDTDTFYPSDFTEDTIFYITEWMLKEGTLFYRLEFYTGSVTGDYAALFPVEPWFKQTEANELIFLETCSVCDKPGCTTEHKYCDVCGNLDCKDNHERTDELDDGTVITVRGDIPEGITFMAEKVDVTQIPDFPWEMYGLTSVNYTLDLTLWNGSEKWQPGEPVEVFIPAAVLGYEEGEEFIAIHRHEDDNGETYVEILGPYCVENGMAKIIMAEFSTITVDRSTGTMKINGVGAFFRAYSGWTGNHNYQAVGVYADTDGNIHIIMEGVSNNTPNKDLEYVKIVHNPQDDKENWIITEITEPPSTVEKKVSSVEAYNADGQLVGKLTPTSNSTWYWDINLGKIEVKGDFGIVVKTSTGQEGNSFNTGNADQGGAPIEIRIYYDIQKTVYSIAGDTAKSGDDVILEQDDKGGDVVYQIVVTNSPESETDLQGIIVTDILPDIFKDGTIQVGTALDNLTTATVVDNQITLTSDLILPPAHSITYYVKGTLKDSSELAVGKHDNIATISGKLVEGDSDPSGIIVPPEEFGSLKISKTVRVPDGAAYTAPEQNFTFTVTFADTVTDFGYQVFASGSSTPIRSGTIRSGGTLELAHNQYAVIDHVTLGNYTVTETAVESFVANQSTHTGTIANQQESVAEFVNTYTVPQGDLLIAKFIDPGEGRQPDPNQEFEFKVILPAPVATTLYNYTIYSISEDTGAIPSDQDQVIESGKLMLGDNYTATITLKNKQYIVISDVILGQYTVTESQVEGYDTPTVFVADKAGDATYTVTDTINGGVVNKVIYYNSVEKTPGDLTITKTVDVLNPNAIAPAQGFTFTTTLVNVSGIDENAQYSIRYTAAEGKGTLSEDQSTYTLNGKTFTLQQTVGLEEEIDATYTFSIELYDGLSATIVDLPYCGYSVTEEPAQNFEAKWLTSQMGLLGAGIDGAVSCKNVYGVVTGNLDITKYVTKLYQRDSIPDSEFVFVVTPSDSITLNGTYDVYISTPADRLPAGQSAVETQIGAVTAKDNQLEVKMSFKAAELIFGLNDSAAKILSIKGVPMGSYTVAETSNDHFTLKTAGTQNATVGTNPGKAIFTNEYKRHLGRLTISKTVTGGNADDTFNFHIKGNGIEMDVTVKGGESVTIYDLPLGSYTVMEDTDWNWRYTTTVDTQTADLTVDQPDSTLEFVNTYTNNQWLNQVIHVLNEFTAGSN